MSDLIHLDKIFEDYKFNEKFPKEPEKLIRGFHEQLRRAENGGFIPKRVNGSRWEWNASDDLTIIHDLMKWKFPELAGKECPLKANGMRDIGPDPTGTQDKKNRPPVKKPWKRNRVDGLGVPVGVPGEGGSDLDPAKTPGSGNLTTAVTPMVVKTPKQKSKTEKKDKVPVPVDVGPPIDPCTVPWFPLSKEQFIGELLKIGKSPAAIAYICDITVKEATEISQSLNISHMGKISDINFTLEESEDDIIQQKVVPMIVA